MRSVVIIPARYNSSRFPGKPLVNLLGKPMVLWVARLSSDAVGRENVYVATDDEVIFNTVSGAGFRAIMTSQQCLTGTDRIAEAAKKIKADIYINVQGDEPLVDPEDIKKIIKEKQKNYTKVINGYCPISSRENPNDINIPKVAFNENGKLIYMSRKAIPGVKDSTNNVVKYYKQVCIYAFTANELENYEAYGRKSTLEQLEDIEIIRFLEWNQEIKMVETKPNSLAVDTPEDIFTVEKALKKSLEC